jgi:hypothetical protein
VRRVYSRRFRSLDSAPWEAREYLTSRLALLRDAQASFPLEPRGNDAARTWAADELVLRMLQHCEPGPDPRGVENGRRELEKYLAQNQNTSLTWERLVEEHWVRVVWGRWHVAFDMREVPNPDQDSDGRDLLLALVHLRKAARKERRFVVPRAEELVAEHRSAHPATPTIGALVDAGTLARHENEICLVRNSAEFRNCGDWIAARLWDRTEAGPSGLPRLSWWRDRVFDLGADWFSFGDHLEVEPRELFLELAWSQILVEQDLVDWEQERLRLAAKVAVASGFGVLQRGVAAVPAVPAQDPIAQLRWIDTAGHVDFRQEERTELGALVSTILRWRIAFRSRGPWNEWIKRLVEEAGNRPYLLYEIHLAVRRDPVIAADFLLVPGAATLGLGALADRMKFTPSTWDREVRTDGDRATEQAVWRDVAECAAWAVCRLDPAQCASCIVLLLERFAGLARPSMRANPERDVILGSRYVVLRDILAHWPAAGGNDALTFDTVGELIVAALRSRLDGSTMPVETAAFDVLTWLAAFGADEQSPWRPLAVRAVVDAYRRSLNGSADLYHDFTLDASTWARIARCLVERDGASWAGFIESPDFDAREKSILLLEEGDRYGPLHSLLHRIRSHLLLLLTLAGGWTDVRRGERVPEPLEKEIETLLLRWLPAEKRGERPSLIDAGVDIEHFFERPRESLVVAIGKVLSKLSPERRTALRDHALSAMTEVRQLAIFVEALDDGPDKEAARERLGKLPVFEGTDDIANIIEVERSVDALLDVGEVDRAEVWLKTWSSKARERKIPGWARWEVGARQRIRLARKQFEEAARAALPEWAQGDAEAQNANDFFRGVALLCANPPRSEEAVSIYERLVGRAPQYPSYAVNLFAARTQHLTHGRGDAEPTPREDDDLRDLLANGESLMSGFTVEQRASVEQTYQANRLYIFHRLRDWSSLFTAYQALPTPLKKDPTLASYAARALESSGQKSLAAALRADLGAFHELPTGPQGTDRLNPVEAARNAILGVPELPMQDQGQAWWGMEIGEAVTITVVDTCTALAGIAPALAQPSNGAPPEEDRVTDLLAALLRQRVLKLGWQVNLREPGGFTAKDPALGRGGRGEVDLAIRSRSAYVAVGEAILVRSGFDCSKLKEHFQRLFGYAPAGVPIMLFLIWSYGSDPASVWKRYCKEVAETEAPVAHEFRKWILPSTGPNSDVWYAMSEHAHPNSVSCRIAHVLVDLRQESRRCIGASSRT